MKKIKNKKKISVVITTYNRFKLLKKIIFSLNHQLNFNYNYEIIICDSNSKNKILILNLIKLYKKLDIKYLNCKINHQAYKRNIGYKFSIGSYVLFIDDDCIPDKYFLYNYHKILKLNNRRCIYTGLVEYLLNKNISHLVRFRQSREKYLDKYIKLKKNININVFGTMNMAISKNLILKNINLFDKRFTKYGFEDYEFAYRFKKYNFNLNVINSKVYHHDFRNFRFFLKKYTYLGYYGINELEKLNLEAAKTNIFYKIKNNPVIIFLTKFKMVVSIINSLENFIIYLESKNLFYHPFIYKSSCFLSYLRGLILYEINKKETFEIDLFKMNNWYK
jgi:glycosyltransferase involved in cell wall biosynthesis